MVFSLFDLVQTTTGLALFSSLLYRVYILLKDGYNPTIEIDTFFPQSGREFTWTGLEIVYDRIASWPIEGVSVVAWWLGMYLVTLLPYNKK
jgi:hypothetical protein